MDFSRSWEDVTREGKERLLRFLRQASLQVPDNLADFFAEQRRQGSGEADWLGVEYTAERALRETFQRFNLDGPALPLLSQALEEYFVPEVEGWVAYPDSVEVLQSLKAGGYRIALVSNATHDPFVRRCVERLGFKSFLDLLVTSADFGARKPSPEIFLHVARSWGAEPAELAMVGDQLYFDVYGAHRAGMRAIWVERNSDKAYTYVPEHLKGSPELTPDGHVNSLKAILDLLRPWKQP